MVMRSLTFDGGVAILTSECTWKFDLSGRVRKCHPETIHLATPILAMLKTRKTGFEFRPPRHFF
jgi:hypothetical protein